MAVVLPAGAAWPDGFLWGAATSAAQVEGAVHADGREDSVWDVFARLPGATAHGDTPERGVEHYARMPSDVALLGELGLGAYRFSVSWARVRPGDRYRNAAGLAFYDRLVDELLARHVEPFLTLYHWDLPQAVEDVGGWTARETAERFVRYVEDVHAVLGDRVGRWTTFNEPFCSAFIGYAAGEHAPGRSEPRAALAALHHQHLAHGLATQRLRELGGPEVQVGVSLNLTNAVPADPGDPVDLDAARRVDALWNRAFTEPLLHGRYPADFLADVGAYRFEELVHDGDLATIAQPLDFLGVNHYHDDCVTGHPRSDGDGDGRGPGGRPTASPFVGSEHVSTVTRDLPLTGMGWEVHPAGLTTLLVRLGREHPGLPLYVTENGAAYPDVVGPDGRVHDPERTAYLEAHVAAVAAAVAAGADVRGYFAWSLLDNFEWAWGYDQRFGLVHVDHASQVRTVKDSGWAYAALVAAATTTATPTRREERLELAGPPGRGPH